MACMKMNEMQEQEHARLHKKVKILRLSWNQHVKTHCHVVTSKSTVSVLFPTWAARCNTWLLIKLTPKGVVFSFLSPLPQSPRSSATAFMSSGHAGVQLSTKRVITMEWVEGCRANDQESMQQVSIRPKDVAVLLLDVFAEMTYVHGFVHADPHPGNILVRPAPDQGRPRAQANV